MTRINNLKLSSFGVTQTNKTSKPSFTSQHNDPTVLSIANHILHEFTPTTVSNYGELNRQYDKLQEPGAIAIRMYYGAPMYLMTDEGRQSIRGSGYTPEVNTEKMEQLKERLGLVEIASETNVVPGNGTLGEIATTIATGGSGTHGPIYAVTKDLQGNPLPEIYLSSVSPLWSGNRSF